MHASQHHPTCTHRTDPPPYTTDRSARAVHDAPHICHVPVQMFTFGLEALREFALGLGQWPQFCAHVLAVPQLREADPALANSIEAILRDIQANPSTVSSGDISGAGSGAAGTGMLLGAGPPGGAVGTADVPDSLSGISRVSSLEMALAAGVSGLLSGAGTQGAALNLTGLGGLTLTSNGTGLSGGSGLAAPLSGASFLTSAPMGGIGSHPIGPASSSSAAPGGEGPPHRPLSNPQVLDSPGMDPVVPPSEAGTGTSGRSGGMFDQRTLLGSLVGPIGGAMTGMGAVGDQASPVLPSLPETGPALGAPGPSSVPIIPNPFTSSSATAASSAAPFKIPVMNVPGVGQRLHTGGIRPISLGDGDGVDSHDHMDKEGSLLAAQVRAWA